MGGTRAVTDTYRYSQDGRLDRGPFVLPAVYDQDEPDASILQAERRRDPRSVRRRRTGLPCRPSPGRARGKPAPPVALGPLHTLPGAPCARTASSHLQGFPELAGAFQGSL